MSDIATTQIFSNGETGITATKMNNIVGQASIQTSFVSGQPLASSMGSTDQLLLLTSGGTYARIPGSAVTSSVSGSLTPAGVGQAGVMNALSGNTTDYVSGANTCIDLTSAPAIGLMRLRSYNAAGNPNFEVNQRQTASTFASGVGLNAFMVDRWQVMKSAGTMNITSSQAISAFNPVAAPGTNFIISNCYLNVTLTTQQASLGATDYLDLQTAVEGSSFRELCADVHSISLLVYSSVASLKFGVALRDPGATKTLTKLCTTSATPNTWSVVTLPNLPVWPTPGTFDLRPGNLGYTLNVTLAAGSTYTSPANDTWQNGNFLGATGQDNFASKAVSSTFFIAFIQHEPGPNCTQLIDKPFAGANGNYEECLRYYFKTWSYGTAVGTATQIGANGGFRAFGAGGANGYCPFSKPMAKTPTCSMYGTNGTLNNAADNNTGTNLATTGVSIAGDKSINQFSAASTLTQGNTYVAHFTADTGW